MNMKRELTCIRCPIGCQLTVTVEGDSVTVGIYVKCSGEGAGAWGKIDDAMLNSAE